jgi:RNase H-fold protein (predicted Holliday junction resolvase)
MYIEWDERLTSFEAKSSMWQIGTKFVRENIDDVAASILLQSYIESKKNPK